MKARASCRACSATSPCHLAESFRHQSRSKRTAMASGHQRIRKRERVACLPVPRTDCRVCHTLDAGFEGKSWPRPPEAIQTIRPREEHWDPLERLQVTAHRRVLSPRLADPPAPDVRTAKGRKPVAACTAGTLLLQIVTIPNMIRLSRQSGQSFRHATSISPNCKGGRCRSQFNLCTHTASHQIVIHRISCSKQAHTV